MTAAAVILQVGKVEVHQMPGVPPPYLRFMRPTKPLWGLMYEQDVEPTTTLDIATIRVTRHRMIGFSVEAAYWPDNWQNVWAVEELLKWEGREDEIRHDKYYADFIVGEDQQAHPNERLTLESESVRRSRQGNKPVVLVVRESVSRRSLDTGSDGHSGDSGLLSLERAIPGGHETDISGEDGE